MAKANQKGTYIGFLDLQKLEQKQQLVKLKQDGYT
jgi:hypothetical protein